MESHGILKVSKSTNPVKNLTLQDLWPPLVESFYKWLNVFLDDNVIEN